VFQTFRVGGAGSAQEGPAFRAVRSGCHGQIVHVGGGMRYQRPRLIDECIRIVGEKNLYPSLRFGARGEIAHVNPVPGAPVVLVTTGEETEPGEERGPWPQDRDGHGR
jgi:hypothetical protein